MTKAAYKAAPDLLGELAHLAVQVSSLSPFPGNARRGNVEAIAESLMAHGQFRPIVVNSRTMQVLAGNHTLEAAISLGWSLIAAVMVDVDEADAKRILVADNRHADLGRYDDEALLAVLRQLPDLKGTGFVPKDLDRLGARLEMFSGATLVNSNHDDDRPVPAHGSPMSTRSVKIGDGLATPAFVIKNYGNLAEAKYRSHPVSDPLGAVTTTLSHALVQPFVTMLRARNQPTGVNDEPLATLATGNHHYLTGLPGAFVVKNHGGLDYARIEHMLKGVDEPLASIMAKPNLSLVIPYRRGKAKTTREPLHTLSTVDSAALCSIEVDIEDCHFRMLKPEEHALAQRFAPDYEMKGNLGERTMQAGNAVSCNAGQWIGAALADVLS